MDRKFTSLILLGLITASLSQNQYAKTPKIVNSIKKQLIILGSAIVGLSVFRFYRKIPVKNPISRFDNNKLKEAIKNKDYKEIRNQLWYFFDDVFVGQSYRGSSLKVLSQKDKNQVIFQESTRPTGFIGHIHANLYPLLKAAGFMIALMKIRKTMEEGLDAWKYHTGYDSDEEFEI